MRRFCTIASADFLEQALRTGREWGSPEGRTFVQEGVSETARLVGAEWDNATRQVRLWWEDPAGADVEVGCAFPRVDIVVTQERR